MRFNDNALKSKYLRIEKGTYMVGVLMGDPVDFMQHYDQQSRSNAVCTEDQACAWCDTGSEANFRFRINFVTRDDSGNMNAYLFENGLSVYKQLHTLGKEGFDFSKMLVKLERGSDNKISVSGVKPLTDEQAELVNNVKLHDLKVKKPGNAQGGNFDDSDTAF